MATISVTVPDEYVADLTAAMREHLGADAQGLTDPQVAKKAVKRFLRDLVAARRRRIAPNIATAVVAAMNAETEKALAIAATVTARKAAEVAEDQAVLTAFGSDS